MHIHIETNRVMATKAELVALASHASKDDSRPHLNCIMFDRPTGYAYATDGHRLIRCRMAAANPAAKPAFAVPLGDVQRLIKTMGPRDVAAVGAKGLSCESSRFAYKPIVAVFPPYALVATATDSYTKEKHAGVSSCFQISYLSDAAAMAAAAETKEIRIYPGPGTMDPLAFTAGPQWLMIVMPMRFADGSFSLKDCTNVGPVVAPVKKAS